MTDRERLTKYWGNNCVATKLNYDFLLSLPNIEVKNFNAIIQKLAHYEDLEEQGKIIVPPCKPGDKLFRVVELLNGVSFVVEGIALEYAETFENGKINKRIYFWANGEEFTRRHYSLWLEISAFGKTVFLTPEEAEKSLKERENNERKTST